MVPVLVSHREILSCSTDFVFDHGSSKKIYRTGVPLATAYNADTDAGPRAATVHASSGAPTAPLSRTIGIGRFDVAATWYGRICTGC